jgi:hypothetical protein
MTALNKDFNPAKLDLFIDQGDDFNKIVTLSDQDGDPIDLTGFTFTASMKEYYNTSKDFSLQVAIFGAPTNGQLRLFMTTTASALLTKQRYVYSIRGTDTVDLVRVLDGQALIQPIA